MYYEGESIERVKRRFYLNLQNTILSLLEEGIIFPQTNVESLQEIIRIKLKEKEAA